jgi:hypothetical protein
VALIKPSFQSENVAHTHFENALKVDFFIQAMSSLVSRPKSACASLKFLEHYSSANKLNIEIKELQSKGILLPEHHCITVALQHIGCETRETFVNGSGDAACKSKARELAIFETIERMSYQISKTASNPTSAILLGDSPEKVSHIHKPLSSTGTATHSAPGKAITSGILECIERDAFLCHWYTNRRPTQITPHGSDLFSYAFTQAEKLDLKLGVFLLESAIPEVVTVLTTVFDPRHRFNNTGYCSGLATSFSFNHALEKSLFELDRFVDLFLSLGTQYEEVKLPPGHPMFRFYHYLKPENLKTLDVFLSTQSTPLLFKAETKRTKNAHWKSLARLLRERGFRTFVYPMPVPESISSNTFCCQTKSPQFQQLDYENTPQLNTERLLSFSPGATLRSVLHPLP